MQPGDSVTKFFRRITPAGVAVTGKVTADFTFVGWYKASGGAVTAYAHGSTITETSTGYYAWTFAEPAVAAHWGVDISVASGTDVIQAVAYGGEVESNDLDSIASSVARPIVSLTGSGTIGQITPITMVNKRYRELVFSFVDANGAAVDMTTYTNITFGVRSKTDDTLTPPKIDAVNGTATGASTYVITPASGSVTVKVPEDATFFILAESTAPDESLELSYELTGDVGGSALKTVSLVQASPLTLIRRDVGT